MQQEGFEVSRTHSITIVTIAAALSVSGCKGVNITDFIPGTRGSGGVEQSRIPPGARVYDCDGGKRLYVRYAGDAKWAMVVFPDREFRLDRVTSGPGERYSNGRANLIAQTDHVALDEGGAVLYANCKPAATKP